MGNLFSKVDINDEYQRKLDAGSLDTFKEADIDYILENKDSFSIKPCVMMQLVARSKVVTLDSFKNSPYPYWREFYEKMMKV